MAHKGSLDVFAWWLCASLSPWQVSPCFIFIIALTNMQYSHAVDKETEAQGRLAPDGGWQASELGGSGASVWHGFQLMAVWYNLLGLLLLLCVFSAVCFVWLLKLLHTLASLQVCIWSFEFSVSVNKTTVSKLTRRGPTSSYWFWD